MTEHYRFFNSAEGDARVYDAGDFAEYFETLIDSGVWADELNALQVTGHGGEMKSIVHTGKAFIDGHFYYNDADLEVEHATADVTNNRLDRVVLRLDMNTGERSLRVAVKTGTPSTTPSPPSVTRTSTVQEYSLAQVLIRAGQSYIEVEDVTDDRGDESVCGYARYRAKPAWYPGGDIPMDVWKYLMFAEEMTAQEIEDVESNPALVAMINNNTMNPIGTIKLWYGDAEEIPRGWAVCNGDNGTPDMTDRIPVGAGGEYDMGDTVDGTVAGQRGLISQAGPGVTMQPGSGLIGRSTLHWQTLYYARSANVGGLELSTTQSSHSVVPYRAPALNVRALYYIMFVGL